MTTPKPAKAPHWEPFRHRCPDCNGIAKNRSSRRVTSTVSELYMRCENDDCGGVYLVQLQVLHRISPPAVPNPTVQIPTRYSRKSAFAPANDDAPANDVAARG